MPMAWQRKKTFKIARPVFAYCAAVTPPINMQIASKGKEASAAELETILRGIDKLGISLQQKIAEERQLVEQLHHKERLASLGQVAAGVAHELRNPLATIRLRAQMSLRTSRARPSSR